MTPITVHTHTYNALWRTCALPTLHKQQKRLPQQQQKSQREANQRNCNNSSANTHTLTHIHNHTRLHVAIATVLATTILIILQQRRGHSEQLFASLRLH